MTDARPTLVLIHGSGGNGLLWNYQTAYFRRKGYPVLPLDLPGHGRTPGPGRNQVGAYADWVEAELKARGIEKPVVGGHSLGSAISLTLALRHPDAYAGLVLVGAGARLRVLPAIFEAIRGNFDSATELMACTAYSAKVSAEELRRGASQLREVEPDVIYGDFEACDHFDVMNELDKVTVPTLIIIGSDDRLTPVKYGQYLRDRIAGSVFHVIDDAGHMVMAEQPQRFNAVLEEFLERVMSNE